MASNDDIKSTNKEVFIVLALYGLFFLWWYLSAYSFGEDPSKYKFICGFPEWFFYSCIVGYLVISFILWGVVHFFFKDISLDEGENAHNE
ncbi:MAG: YhdT family protein [Synergistaceae bacterium]